MRVIFVLLIIIAIAWAFYPSWMPLKEYTFLVSSEEDTELIKEVVKSKNWDVNFLILDKKKRKESEAICSDNFRLSLNDDVITFGDQWRAILGKGLGADRLKTIDPSIPSYVINEIHEAANKREHLKVLDILNKNSFDRDNIELSAEIDFQKCLLESVTGNPSKALNLCNDAVEKAPKVDFYIYSHYLA